ncbi:MAG: hypothetical protein ACFCVE_14400 [Phycisphaerae bacterium]
MKRQILEAPGLPTRSAAPAGLQFIVPSVTKLVDAVREASDNRNSVTHGEAHWKCVAWSGLDLAHATPGADPAVVFLFALLHDSQRHPDAEPADHGRRAVELADRLSEAGLIRLDAVARGRLDEALLTHHAGALSDCPTVGACFDADRLQLWRLGFAPPADDMSTRAGRCPKRIAKGKCQLGRHKDWLSIFTGFEMLKMMQAG